jgi:hypothetical protein
MKLLTLGCSFTRGSELQTPEVSAWPSLLAKKLGGDVDNLAEFNGSNDMMFRKAMERDQDYDLIIVTWTESHRMEIWLNDKIISQKRRHPIGPFSVNHNSVGDALEWVKPFFANHYDEQYFLRKWLCQVVALQDHFKISNQRYLFLTAFGNEEPLQRYQGVLKSKIDKKYWVGWPDQSIMSWTAGTPYGPYGHPLERGHEIVADRIYEYIRHLGWVS